MAPCFVGEGAEIVRFLIAFARSRWWGSVGPLKGTCHVVACRPTRHLAPARQSPLPIASISVLRARSMRCDRGRGAPSTGCPAPADAAPSVRETETSRAFSRSTHRGESSGRRSQNELRIGRLSSRRFPVSVSAPPQNFHLILPSPPQRKLARRINGECRCAHNPKVLLLILQSNSRMIFLLSFAFKVNL
jgi:hypothetical protein